jgi:hypothetical protein
VCSDGGWLCRPCGCSCWLSPVVKAATWVCAADDSGRHAASLPAVAAVGRASGYAALQRCKSGVAEHQVPWYHATALQQCCPCCGTHAPAAHSEMSAAAWHCHEQRQWCLWGELWLKVCLVLISKGEAGGNSGCTVPPAVSSLVCWAV